MQDDLILVTGAGGFIGGHLVADLLRRGHSAVRGVDIKPLSQWHQRRDAADNVVADLREKEACVEVCRGATQVYNLACDMGGMGFIELNKARCMISVLINTHLLMAASQTGVQRYFFASSACVYNADKQRSASALPLKESDVYPALAEDGYGWEKAFFRADVPSLCRRLRPRDEGGPTPQRLRTAWYVGWWA